MTDLRWIHFKSQSIEPGFYLVSSFVDPSEISKAVYVGDYNGETVLVCPCSGGRNLRDGYPLKLGSDWLWGPLPKPETWHECRLGADREGWYYQSWRVNGDLRHIDDIIYVAIDGKGEPIYASRPSHLLYGKSLKLRGNGWISGPLPLPN